MAAKLSRLVHEFHWGRMDEVAAIEAARTPAKAGGMNAPFVPSRVAVRLADPGDRPAIARFLADHPDTTAFHLLEWLDAVERATGHRTHILLSEQDTTIRSVLPLHEAHSPLFGRALVSSGFAVGGGVVGEGDPSLVCSSAGAGGPA